MRKVALAGVAAALTLSAFAATSASADTRTCYTLGVPGQPHYEECTYLPVDPNGIIR